MATSDSDSSDTEHEWGARRHKVASQASYTYQDSASSESDANSNFSTRSYSQNETDSEDNSDTDIGHAVKYQNESTASARASPQNEVHGFAKTIARRPEINRSSSGSDSTYSKESENAYETSREEIAQSGGSSRQPSTFRSDHAFSEQNPFRHVKKTTFPTNEVADLKRSPLVTTSVRTTASPNSSDQDDLGNNRTSRSARSNATAREPDQTLKRQPLEPSQHINAKKRRRGSLGDMGDKGPHARNKKRRGKSPMDRLELSAPRKAISLHPTGDDAPEPQSDQHSTQLHSVGGWKAIKRTAPAKSKQAPVAASDVNGEGEADDEQEEEENVEQPNSFTKKTPSRKHQRRLKAKSGTRTSSDNKKTGRFSKKENQEMERFKQGWCVQYQIDERTFNNCINRRRKSGFPPSVDFTKSQMLEEFLEVLPDRDKRSMFRYKERNWQNVEATPYEWTNEQDRELQALVEEHGSKWTTIADHLGRGQDDVAQRWRNHIANKDTMRTGNWSGEEIQELRNAIEDASYSAGDNLTVDQISWDSVSKMMRGSRTAQQCAGKWQKLMVNERKEKWLADNHIVAPEGYQVRLVTVRKGNKKQKPQRAHNSHATSSKRKARKDESVLDIERPPDDSPEETSTNGHSTNESDNPVYGGESGESDTDNVRPRAPKSVPSMSPASRARISRQAKSTMAGSIPVTDPKRSLAHSAKASKKHNTVSPGASTSSRSLMHRRNSFNPPLSPSLILETCPSGNTLRLGDAFSATSPAAHPPTSQEKFREDRPSPHITVKRIPERRAGQSALSQTLGNATEVDDEMELEDVNANKDSNDSLSDDSEQSEDGAESSEEAGQEGLRANNSHLSNARLAGTHEKGAEDGEEGLEEKDREEEVEEVEDEEGSEDEDEVEGSTTEEEEEDEGDESEQNVETEPPNMDEDEAKTSVTNSIVQETETGSSESDTSEESEDDSDGSDASEQEDESNEDDSASTGIQPATPTKADVGSVLQDLGRSVLRFPCFTPASNLPSE